MTQTSIDEAPAVELIELRKAFGSVAAVNGVSMRVAESEFVTLLGPSGCGKTTTLRLIAGFERPTSGEVMIGGAPMSRRAPYQRPVNTVFQSYALFPNMTVGQNVEYGLKMSGVTTDERGRRVDEALEMVRLPNLAKRKPSELSGGQQQRVALARAIVNRPRVLLFDEPLGALDLKLRREMQLELKDLNREIGATFIYVTHDQEEALALSDRIAVMDAGRVLQIDTPAEIYERPATRFVAEFIGQTNFLDGRFKEQDGDIAQIVLSGGATIWARRSRGSAIAGDVTVAIRPEKIALSPESNDSALTENRLDGVVIEAIYLGAHTQYLVNVGQTTKIVVHRQNAATTDDRIQPGQTVRLAFDPGSASIIAA